MEQEKANEGCQFIYVDKSWPRYIYEVFTDEMNGNLGVMSADEMRAVIESLEAPLNVYKPLKKEEYRQELTWQNIARDFPYLAHDIRRKLYWLPPKRDTTYGNNPILLKRLVSEDQLEVGRRSGRTYSRGLLSGIPTTNTCRSVKTGEVLTDLSFHLQVQTGYSMDEWFVMLGQYEDPITGDKPFSNWLEDDEYPIETYFRKFKSGLYSRKNGKRIARRLHQLSAVDSALALNFRAGVSNAELLTDFVLGDKMGANFPRMFVTR